MKIGSKTGSGNSLPPIQTEGIHDLTLVDDGYRQTSEYVQVRLRNPKSQEYLIHVKDSAMPLIVFANNLGICSKEVGTLRTAVTVGNTKKINNACIALAKAVAAEFSGKNKKVKLAFYKVGGKTQTREVGSKILNSVRM